MFTILYIYSIIAIIFLVFMTESRGKTGLLVRLVFTLFWPVFFLIFLPIGLWAMRKQK